MLFTKKSFLNFWFRITIKAKALLIFSVLMAIFIAVSFFKIHQNNDEKYSALATSSAAAESAKFLVIMPSDPAGDAAKVLAKIVIKGRAPKTGYSREKFGKAWSDVDHNGCDTRNDILRRDLESIVAKLGTKGCVITSGVLKDPYSGKNISFIRGIKTSSAVQIDHVVALSDAWQKGAQQLSATNKVLLANDPLNLLAVDGALNRQKGDGDAATWLPPNKNFRCNYVSRQVAVKEKYSLWMTPAEHDAIARVLSHCPTQQLPTNSKSVK